jgi:hypothetical protein
LKYVDYTSIKGSLINHECKVVLVLINSSDEYMDNELLV